MRYTFQSEQWIPYPVEVVFAFFANPENLPRLMPAWQKARIEEAVFAAPPAAPQSAMSAPLPKGIAAGVGTRLTLSFLPFPWSPIRIPWEAEISEFVWNDHFCDDQVRGPFAFWHHCHSVYSEPRATASDTLIHGTLLRDQVEYEPPYGALGDLAKRLFLGRQMKDTFAFRQKRTSELLAIAFALNTGSDSK